jgi:hypothetical protein
MIQRPDQELWTCWADTLVWAVVRLDQTPSVLISDILSTIRKTASKKSCKNFNTIQQSDQELWTCWAARLVVWRNQTSSASRSNFILTRRKKAFGNSYKNLSMIQRSDLELGTFWVGTMVWSVVWRNQTPSATSNDFIATPRKTTSRNSCNNFSTNQQFDQELWTF